ncbi:MAG: choice-of-anchor Q domain-containing protein, partial [Thermoleophilaceae bacterium]
AAGPELHLLDSSVTGNRAGSGGANGIGGGIKVSYGTGATPVVTLDRSSVNGNTAGGNGGNGFGGGIDASSEGMNTTLDMTLTQTTVAGNVAGGNNESYGGGIEAGSGGDNGDATITLDRSTVSGNRTAKAGGAAGVDFQSGGSSVDEHLTVTNSTIAGNNAASGTGGIAFVSSGSGSTADGLLKHATLAGNGGVGLQGSASFTVQNSILANNSGGNCDGSVGGHAGNVESADTCGLTIGNDKPSTDPRLKPLGNYGGPTRTMLPNADSPALGNGNSGLCLSEDQRGVTRPQGTGCDSGADEAQIADVAVSAARSPKTVSAGRVVTYEFTIANKGPQVAQGVILRDKLPAKLRLVSFKGCSGKPARGCVLGTVAVGTTRTVSIKARALRSGKVTNRGRITSFAADPAAGNDSAATTVTILPSLTGLTMTPKTFPAGAKTTIRFKLSDPGQVTLTVARKGSDGKFHKVLAPKLAGKRGKNKHLLDSNGLSPGRYRLSARVKDGGGRRSKAAKLTFKVTS